MKQQLFVALQHCLPQQLLSRLTGKLADCTCPAIKDRLIRAFIDHYKVDMSEALESDPAAYRHFNAFFTRALKEGARPMPSAAEALACPVDGEISQIGRIDDDQIFQAKGHSYSLSALLGGNAVQAQPFRGGHFATLYLSPRDYHRIHMPQDARLRQMIHVPGRLFSVNTTTTEHVPGLFARNERAVCLFDTAQGPMALVLVGAMIVASIETVWHGLVAPRQQQRQTFHYGADTPAAVHLARGEEMGRFRLGSTVIVLLGPGQVSWAASLAAGQPVQLGQPLGTLLSEAAACA